MPDIVRVSDIVRVRDTAEAVIPDSPGDFAPLERQKDRPGDFEEKFNAV